MTHWRFALTRRWAGYLALTIVFAIVCSGLGMWQFARRAEARQEIARIDANYDAAPTPVTEVLPDTDAFSISQKWTPVRLEGEYLEDEQLLVRNRALGGRPGFDVVVPLRLTDGTIFVVDRGWVPTGERQDSPDSVPQAPAGDVVVVARLRASEPNIAGRSTVSGSNEIQTVNLDELATVFGERLGQGMYTGAYGLVSSESPAPASAPQQSLRPERDEGPHLSYALQWFVFALLAFIGLGWALRQEYRLVNAEDPEEIDRSADRARRRAARSPGDDEIEDAILERQQP